MRGLDQPACPIVLNMALARQSKLTKELFDIHLRDIAVAISSTHELVEVIGLLRQVHFTFDTFQILLKLLNRVILCDLLDGSLKLNAFFLQLVPLDSLLDEGNVRSKVVVELCGDLAESADDLFDQVRVRVLHVEEPEQLMYDLG